MNLPTTPDQVVVDNDPIQPATINNMQTCITGGKLGPRWYNVPLIPINSAQITVQNGYIFTNATPNGFALILIPQASRNTRIYEWRFLAYNNSGAGNLTFKLRKGVTNIGGVVVASDVDTVTLVNPPGSFQVTDRASAVFTSAPGVLDQVGINETRWFELTLPTLDARVSMMEVLLEQL